MGDGGLWEHAPILHVLGKVYSKGTSAGGGRPARVNTMYA